MPELRRALRAAGVKHPLWCEVPKAKKAPAQVRRALKAGVDVVFAWGGDGMVRRCINEMAGTKTRLAVLPAGTSNLFARSLGIPSHIAGAVEVGLHGVGREVDVALDDERGQISCPIIHILTNSLQIRQSLLLGNARRCHTER